MSGIIYNIKSAYKIIGLSDLYEHTKIKYIHGSLLVLQVMIACICFIIKEYTQFAMLFYLSWLSTMALVDYYTGYVYTKMRYITYIPIACCLIILLLSYKGYIYLIEIIIILLICFVILKLMEYTCGMGDGDVDVLMIGMLFVSFIKIYNTTTDISVVIHIVLECLITNFALFSAAGFLFSIRHAVLINPKSMTLKENKPFVPSIYMAAVVYYILLF